MKTKVTFREGNTRIEHSVEIMIEETNLSMIIKNEALLNIIKEEKKLAKMYNQILYITKIEDID